jgi:hypothetical protein
LQFHRLQIFPARNQRQNKDEIAGPMKQLIGIDLYFWCVLPAQGSVAGIMLPHANTKVMGVLAPSGQRSGAAVLVLWTVPADTPH